jgi:formylglycine-generating enzyme required for sulfatase activity
LFFNFIKNRKMKSIFIICLCTLSIFCFGNNVEITNLSLGTQNTVNNTYQVKFDISWENSWRTTSLESNYDAVWVFIKFKSRTQSNWNHGILNATGQVPSGLSSVRISPDLRGAMVFRGIPGLGNISLPNMELQLNYGTTIADDDRVEISVHAVEMVFVPQDAFYVGDGTSTSVAGQFGQGATANPFLITSELALNLGGTLPTNLGTRNNTIIDDFNAATIVTLPAAFPKGYTGFFCMKYETSQAQYVDFLNKLTPTQALARFPNPVAASALNAITNTGPSPNIYITDEPYRACNGLSWEDAAAYADWACLRPMTELEYEKACRGTEAPIANELAWGTAFGCALRVSANVINKDAANEIINNPCVNTGNYHGGFSSGTPFPFRCGIFAASAINKTREETGATYYGIMEMTGNVEEFVVGVNSATQRLYAGAHGDGILLSTGSASIPGLALTEACVKGGSLSGNIFAPRVSHRAAIVSSTTTRDFKTGFRLARTTF